MLCALHAKLMDSNITKTTSNRSGIPSSLPGSPASHSSSGALERASANVRRTGSFGSILDSPVIHTERSSRSVLRFGHRRSHSGSQNHSDSGSSPTNEKASTLPFRQRMESSVSDPFDQLETVWESLECWFDLVNAEVERVKKEEQLGTEVRWAHVGYIQVS